MYEEFSTQEDMHQGHNVPRHTPIGSSHRSPSVVAVQESVQVFDGLRCAVGVRRADLSPGKPCLLDASIVQLTRLTLRIPYCHR